MSRQWSVLFDCTQAQWKAKCKKAWALAKARHLQHEYNQWAGRHQPSVRSCPSAPAAQSRVVCSLCQAAFADAKALSVHHKKMHNISASVRAYMFHPTRCESCLTNFHTTQRLRQHLQWRPELCLRHLQEVHQPLDDQEIAEQETVLQSQTDYRMAAFREPGPLLPSLAQWRQACPTRGRTWLLPLDEAVVLCGDWILNDCRPDDAATWVLPASIPAGMLLQDEFLDYLQETAQAAFGSRVAQRILAAIMAPAERTGAPAQCDVSARTGIPMSWTVVLWFQADDFLVPDMYEAWEYMRNGYDAPVQLLPVGTEGFGGIQNLAVPTTRAFWCQVVRDGGVHALFATPWGPTWGRNHKYSTARSKTQPFGELEVTPKGRCDVYRDNDAYLAFADLSRAATDAGTCQVAVTPHDFGIELLSDRLDWVEHRHHCLWEKASSGYPQDIHILGRRSGALAECLRRWACPHDTTGSNISSRLHLALAETLMQAWCRCASDCVKSLSDPAFDRQAKHLVKRLAEG
eukprot:Skav207432  [mRNA]  locus=scaffold1798:155360:156910:+ [translate_table: standard]